MASPQACRRPADPQTTWIRAGYHGVTAIALMGALGLAVDLGRVFIAKNETQAFCDAAALAAALALDGTSTGITSAQAAVTSSTNQWNFGTTAVSSPTVVFATASQSRDRNRIHLCKGHGERAATHVFPSGDRFAEYPNHNLVRDRGPNRNHLVPARLAPYTSSAPTPPDHTFR